MTPEKVEAILVGKTISSIVHLKYLGWDMCIEEIEFTDGTKICLGGNADYARIDDLVDECGVTHVI